MCADEVIPDITLYFRRPSGYDSTMGALDDALNAAVGKEQERLRRVAADEQRRLAAVEEAKPLVADFLQKVRKRGIEPDVRVPYTVVRFWSQFEPDKYERNSLIREEERPGGAAMCWNLGPQRAPSKSIAYPGGIERYFLSEVGEHMVSTESEREIRLRWFKGHYVSTVIWSPTAPSAADEVRSESYGMGNWRPVYLLEAMTEFFLRHR